MAGQSGSLAGLKVLDLSRMLPGPYCSMILADHGAEVIAIEDRRFAVDNLFFSALYRNKRHLSLNLKTAAGREIFLRLAAAADVVIEGFRPGVVQRLGIDYQTLRQQQPKLIYCSITGYGQTGPARHRAGHDINYLSTSGILDLVGSKDGPPIIPGVQIADIAGGSLSAVIGILLALVARDRYGEGQYIDIAMTDSVLGMLLLPEELGRRAGAPLRRGDHLLAHRFACYHVYPTADERYVAVGALEHRFWEQLCRLLELPQYVDRQYDESCRDEVIDAVGDRFRSRTAAAWEALLADHDVCVTVVAHPDEIWTNPLFIERGMVVGDAAGAAGPAPSLGIPIKLSRTPGSIRSKPDTFGGSSTAILQELGYASEQIDALRREGVI